MVSVSPAVQVLPAPPEYDVTTVNCPPGGMTTLFASVIDADPLVEQDAVAVTGPQLVATLASHVLGAVVQWRLERVITQLEVLQVYDALPVFFIETVTRGLFELLLTTDAVENCMLTVDAFPLTRP